jgi:hypothetical protein
VESDRPSNTADLEGDLGQVLAMYDDCWARLDLTGITALWDESYESPTYIGSEYRGPLVGWPELRRHWSKLAARLQEASVRSTLVHVARLAPALALVVFLCEWSFVAVESPALLTGQDWVTALFQKNRGQWLFILYSEAPAYQAVGAKTQTPP